MKLILLVIGMVLLCGSVNANDINLLDHTNKQFININTSAIIANTEQTIAIPIYNGMNIIGIPVYPSDPTLNNVFNTFPVTNDKIGCFVTALGWQSATYYSGWGWYENPGEHVEPIKPTVGYKYIRVGVDCTLSVTGTYLPRNTYNKYSIFDYSNYMGKNIIRPLRSVNYD